MGKRITSADLRRDLSSLGKAVSNSGITLYFKNPRGDRIAVTGVPYDIENGDGVDTLVIGPYFRDLVNPVPDDFKERQIRIPVESIFWYRRWEI